MKPRSGTDPETLQALKQRLKDEYLFLTQELEQLKEVHRQLAQDVAQLAQDVERLEKERVTIENPQASAEVGNVKRIHREDVTPKTKATPEEIEKNRLVMAKNIKIGNKRGSETVDKKETESPKVSRKDEQSFDTPPPRPSIPPPFVSEARNRSNAFFKEPPKKPEEDKQPRPGPLIGRRK